MVFSSAVFLFIFLPLVLVVYYLSKKEYRNYILLAASIIFYGYGEPKFVYVMLASVLINYLMAIAIEGVKKGSKALLVLDVILNLGLLFIFKYLGFTSSIINKLSGGSFKLIEIALPIGISFFTFQALSYVIDVYRGDVKAQRNIFKLGLFISLFPQLIAGPIVRYNTVVNQIDDRKESLDKLGEGTKRFILGLMKKVILANNLALVAEQYFDVNYAEVSVLGCWIGAICFGLQIFFDFSGYSDMAIGLGKMFGFEFEENFNYPYVASSITDFWRRWHISLSRWFRDYVYIPLGGSRVRVGRHIFNLFVVWTLTGLWHGANYTFILWGFLYFVALVIEKYIIKPDDRKSLIFKTVYRALTVLYVFVLWIIFNSPDIVSASHMCLELFGRYNGTLYDKALLFQLRQYGTIIIAGILFATPCAKFISAKLKTICGDVFDKWIMPFVYLAGFLWCVSFLVLGAHNPFIYFNF